MNKKIVLTSLNAKYVHPSLGLRYIYANMGDLQQDTIMHEYSINARTADIAESLAAYQPGIIGMGVYIWNVEQTLALIRLLRQILDNVVIVLGGPEVSYETRHQQIVEYADYVLCGQADTEFAILCNKIFSGRQPKDKIQKAAVKNLDSLLSPYPYYSDQDIKNRVIYVEASRGCPFKCEFCLSALDKTSIAFNRAHFLSEMEKLFVRGARHFKFVDRTFNLKITDSQAILKFFLDKLNQFPDLDKHLHIHFEIIPDRLPEQLKELIIQFPPGCLQFEIGIQTFNSTVQQLISRKQDNNKSRQNMLWLKQQSKAHLHADLIAGLPGENWDSFAKGFDELARLKPHEIQLGILKRLKGTPIIRHSEKHRLKFNHQPTFDILSTDCLSYQQIRDLVRFARYWDITYNSGNFKHCLELILADKPFQQFHQFSRWLYRYSENTHRFSLRRLYDLLYLGGQQLGFDKQILWDKLWLDYQQSGLKGKPEFMKV